jgi:hypothetical protein
MPFKLGILNLVPLFNSWVFSDVIMIHLSFIDVMVLVFS